MRTFLDVSAALLYIAHCNQAKRPHSRGNFGYTYVFGQREELF